MAQQGQSQQYQYHNRAIPDTGGPNKSAASNGDSFSHYTTSNDTYVNGKRNSPMDGGYNVTNPPKNNLNGLTSGKENGNPNQGDISSPHGSPEKERFLYKPVSISIIFPLFYNLRLLQTPQSTQDFISSITKRFRDTRELLSQQTKQLNVSAAK